MEKLPWAVGYEEVQKPLIFSRWLIFLKLLTFIAGKSREGAAFNFVLEENQL